AHEARPDLWHSWTALVYSLLDTQRVDDALQLAGQMTERFPLVPRVWPDLAMVHQARLDENGVADALQHALRINPAWGTAIQQLAEVHQRAGRFEEAKTLLERAIAYTPLDHTTHAYLADVLWQLGERDLALERVKHAVTLEPGYDWAWRAMREWARLSGKPEYALECARALTEKRPGQARSWLVLAQTEGQSFDERLQSLDRVIELSPRSTEAHSLRARLLTQLQRYDEARAACRPEVYGDNIPPELRCAEAVVEAERGDVNAAIERMKKLVEDEPNYYPAWSLMADWYRSLNSFGDYLHAAQEMVRVVPHRAVPLGYLADAQLLNDEPRHAKETLRHAMTLDPSYEFAGTALFDLQLKDYELDDAEETLKVIRQQIGGDAATVRDLKLAGRRKQFDVALAHFKTLCLSETDDGGFIAEALEADMETDWKPQAFDVIDSLMTSPQANPNLGTFFVQHCERKQYWETCERKLAAFPEHNELWRRAVNAYLEALMKAGQKHRARTFIQKQEKSLRSQSQTWGNAGYILMSLGDSKKTIDWLSDWRSHDGLEGWMLWNLALALRTHGRDRESNEVSREAIKLQPDHLTQSNLLLIAFDETLDGDLANANPRIEKINEPTLRDWDNQLFQLIRLLRQFQTERQQGAARFNSTVTKLLGRMLVTDSELLTKLARRAIERIAKERNSVWFTLWVKARLLWTTLEKAIG
ncbi:MAG: tetratricopeptide repeat protein, partial [Blastocatellia bacterium]